MRRPKIIWIYSLWCKYKFAVLEVLGPALYFMIEYFMICFLCVCVYVVCEYAMVQSINVYACVYLNLFVVSREYLAIERFRKIKEACHLKLQQVLINGRCFSLVYKVWLNNTPP